MSESKHTAQDPVGRPMVEVRRLSAGIGLVTVATAFLGIGGCAATHTSPKPAVSGGSGAGSVSRKAPSGAYPASDGTHVQNPGAELEPRAYDLVLSTDAADAHLSNALLHTVQAGGQPPPAALPSAGMLKVANQTGDQGLPDLSGGEAPEAQAQDPASPECLGFAKDPGADLGEVLRAGCEPTLAQMSALMDNPLGNVAMLFTQVDLFKMENPVNDKSANKWNYMGIAQFPKAVNEDWNLINRIVWNVPSMPLDQDKIDRAADRASRIIGEGPGGAVLPPTGGVAPIDLFDGRTTGFGDMYYNGLFAPKKAIDLDGGGKFLWGAGFDLGIPTATEDILGTGKWLAGPSALGVYMGPKWKIGGLVQQYWDFAGDDDRDDVNLTNLQYFIYYSLDDTTSIGAAPNIIANWEQDSDNVLTLPIGIGINKTFQFGKVPVRVGAEFHYSAVQPNDAVGTEWDFRFYVIPAAPSALFEWMTKPLFGG